MRLTEPKIILSLISSAKLCNGLMESLLIYILNNVFISTYRREGETDRQRFGVKGIHIKFKWSAIGPQSGEIWTLSM